MSTTTTTITTILTTDTSDTTEHSFTASTTDFPILNTTFNNFHNTTDTPDTTVTPYTTDTPYNTDTPDSTTSSDQNGYTTLEHPVLITNTTETPIFSSTLNTISNDNVTSSTGKINIEF